MKENDKYTAYDQFSYEQKESWLRDMSERMLKFSELLPLARDAGVKGFFTISAVCVVWEVLCLTSFQFSKEP